MDKWNNKNTNKLAEAILALKNVTEAKQFLRDLLTEAEILEFGKRWETAQMLNNNIPYSKIEERTGLSSATVARVAQWLRKGKGGYRLVLQRTAPHHTNPL